MSRRLLGVACCLLLVTAGCVAPVQQPTPTQPRAADPFAAQSGTTPTGSVETLRFDPARTMAIVAELLRVRAVTANITVYDAEPARVTITPGDVASRTPFQGETLRALGYENATVVRSGASGYASGREITLIRRDATPAAVERVFAHEYTHVLQCTRSELQVPLDPERWRRSMDYRLTTRTLIEGGAVLLTDRYVRDHLPDQPRPGDQRLRRYRGAPPLLKLGTAPYAVGYRYLEGRTERPAAIGSVYQRRPTSTEQLLHNETRRTEPVERLGLTVSVTNGSFQRRYRYRMGELLLRTTLDTELDSAQARAAAAGWGTDALVRFQADNTSGYVWVVRWDNRSAARTFEDAATTYAERRAQQSEWSFSATRYNDTITLLVFGENFTRSMVHLSPATAESARGVSRPGDGQLAPGGSGYTRPTVVSELNRSAVRACTTES